MLIPKAETAVVDIRKLRDYCLNPGHAEGKQSATIFDNLGDDSGRRRRIARFLAARSQNE